MIALQCCRDWPLHPNDALQKSLGCRVGDADADGLQRSSISVTFGMAARTVLVGSDGLLISSSDLRKSARPSTLTEVSLVITGIAEAEERN